MTAMNQEFAAFASLNFFLVISENSKDEKYASISKCTVKLGSSI